MVQMAVPLDGVNLAVRLEPLATSTPPGLGEQANNPRLNPLTDKL